MLDAHPETTPGSSERSASKLDLAPNEMRELGYRVVDMLVSHFENLRNKPATETADRNELKKRYFIRLTKLADKDAVCIDAWPRFQDEARNFKMARMMLDLSKMEPMGLLLMMPNGTDYYSYKFEKVDINPKNPLDLLNDPWKVKIPAGWTTRVEQMPGPQMGNRAGDPVR